MNAQVYSPIHINSQYFRSFTILCSFYGQDMSRNIVGNGGNGKKQRELLPRQRWRRRPPVNNLLLSTRVPASKKAKNEGSFVAFPDAGSSLRGHSWN